MGGKILAGEIVSPGNFSLRTLAVVKNINALEAEQFLSIAPYVVGGIYEKQLVADDDILKNMIFLLGLFFLCVSAV